MRPTLFFAIQRARRYIKKHNPPDHMEMTDEFVQKLRDRVEHMDYDCTTVEEKLRKGLTLEKVQLAHCTSWLVSREQNPKDKIIYYIHGGGFVNGSAKQLFKFISYAVRHFGYNLYAVDYRLTPVNTCIDTITDCENGYKYLLEHYAPENIVLMGESAGGNLVLALPQKLKDDNLPLPAGLVASSPVVQFLHYAYSYYECAFKTDYGILFGINDVTRFYKGELPLDHPYLSPLCGDLRNYPPTYLDASNVESLRDDARMMFVRLKEEGCDVEYHELKDFFHAMLTAPQYRFVRREEHTHVLAFIHRVFGDKKDEK
ncbi:MAG: alpha/beta hydrolase fold domain-containing protein [Clostridia bacterium]|nr:alpha/beta hydrolase fold domain-containing protein [Clostridia bacterium]